MESLIGIAIGLLGGGSAVAVMLKIRFNRLRRELEGNLEQEREQLNREVESRLEEVLRRYESSPQFVIEPLFRVAVAGEVKQPSLYSLSPAITLAEAVALAGGPTDRGRLDDVTLVRDGRARDVDLTDPGSDAFRMRVRSGDQVLVRRQSRIFRDYVVPAFSITGAIATILNLALR